MKSRITSLSIAAVLTAGLVMAPGVAMAATPAAPVASTSASNSLMMGGVASAYGMWFVPCDLGFIKWC
ncbi:hypothetical protein [Arthrobacter sp. AQ5-05]|uniref:hypothetical protein n=1 Tax=Arthrobacter sp. AQ5-05 TaxID=2184581 RepID=UPI0012B62A04|nr:hypothetical protein [Arthrobacter sp. AQ5-05]